MALLLSVAPNDASTVAAAGATTTTISLLSSNKQSRNSDSGGGEMVHLCSVAVRALRVPSGLPDCHESPHL